MTPPTPAPKEKPQAFWWLIWLVLFLVVFNLVLFGKFVFTSAQPKNGVSGTQTVEPPPSTPLSP